MILLAHIIIALASLAFAAFVLVSPSGSRLRASYALAALTLITGTYLVISAPAHMVQACVTGLVYLGLISIAIVSARHKLLTREQ